MEAKDTVRLGKVEELSKLPHMGELYMLAVEMLKAQAEISFKAGMREAVEWIEKNSHKGYIFEGTYEYDTKCDNQIFTDLGDWQAQKRGWGIDD